MEDSRYGPLFEPLRLGPVTAPNRIAFTAHTTNLARYGLPDERLARYYGRRAEGGAGLIVLEESSVHPSDHPYERVIRGYEPAVVQGYRRVAEAVHPYGAVVVAQLNHTGMQGTGHIRKQAIWAPSPVPNPATMEMPKVMEPEDISAVVAGFGQVAQRAVEAGLDGVEINAGQYSLVRQFLSGLTNSRQDAYGGSPEARLRFATDVIRQARTAVGRQGVVGLRLAVDEFAPWAGITPDQGVEIARALTASGDLDYLSVVVGSIYTVYKTRAAMHTAPGYALDVARAIREAVAVPVYATGSIVDPALAAEALGSGTADGVEMTRALIADPDLPLKVREGRADEVRPCIRCNQDCTVRSLQNVVVSCIHNPEAGYEAEFPPPERTARPKRVLVVGGGPAGMEAARVAALRGHQVTLVEREPELGGTPLLVATAPEREPMRLVSDWRIDQLRRLDVAVRTGTDATPDFVRAFPADVVVLATGGRSRPGERVPGIDLPHVVPVRDALRGQVPGSGRVVVIDEQGYYPAIDAAQAVALTRRPVTVVTGDSVVSTQLGSSGEISPWYSRASVLDIDLRPLVEVVSIEPEAVVLRPRFGPGSERIEGVDAVVLASYELPDDALYQALVGEVPNLHRIGDCLAPRRVLHAVLEGNRLGRSI